MTSQPPSDNNTPTGWLPPGEPPSKEDFQNMFTSESELQWIALNRKDTGRPKKSHKTTQKKETNPTSKNTDTDPLPIDQENHQELGEAVANLGEAVANLDFSNEEVSEGGTESDNTPSTEPLEQSREPRVGTLVMDNDVVLGRGELANKHPGNKRFRKDRDKLQAKYFRTERHRRKEVAIQLMTIVHGRGGAFLKKEGQVDLWNEVSEKEALEKCSHALRERRKKKSSAFVSGA